MFCAFGVGVVESGKIGREYGCFAPELVSSDTSATTVAGGLRCGAVLEMDVLASVRVLHSAPT